MAEAILLEAWIKAHIEGPSGAQQRDAEKGFEALRLSVSGLAAAAVAAATVVADTTIKISEGLRKLYYDAQYVRGTTEKLNALEQAVSSVGGSGKAAIADLKTFTDKLKDPAYANLIKSIAHLTAEQMKEPQEAFIAWNKFLAKERESDPGRFTSDSKIVAGNVDNILAMARPQFDEAYEERQNSSKGLNEIAEKSKLMQEAWLKLKDHLNNTLALSSGEWMDISSQLLEKVDTVLNAHKAEFKAISDYVAGMFLDPAGKLDATAFGKRINIAVWGAPHDVNFALLKSGFINFANWLEGDWLGSTLRRVADAVEGAMAPGIGRQQAPGAPGSQGRFSKGQQSVGRAMNAPAASPGTNTSGAPSQNPLTGHSTASAAGVDPRLVSIVDKAATYLPPGYSAKIQSGVRPGDPGFHGKGMAEDVMIIDPQGKQVPNYQSGASFRLYEEFAQHAKAIQMQEHPELDNKFRWGGYFGGPAGKYGAVDLMHMDLGGSAMAGGSFEHGLTDAQKRLYPDAQSKGMGPDYKLPVDGEHPIKGNLTDIPWNRTLDDIKKTLHSPIRFNKNIAAIHNASPLGSGRNKFSHRSDSARAQNVHVNVTSTDPHSAATEVARQLAHLQTRTLKDWRRLA